MRRLIVFDMDSTLIQQEVLDELAKAAGVEQEVQNLCVQDIESRPYCMFASINKTENMTSKQSNDNKNKQYKKHTIAGPKDRGGHHARGTQLLRVPEGAHDTNMNNYV